MALLCRAEASNGLRWRLARSHRSGFGRRPRGIPNVIERVSWSVQFPSDVHQLAAQFGKEIAEPGCVPARMSQLSTRPIAMGSPTLRNTMGMVVVWSLAATEALEPHGIKRSRTSRCLAWSEAGCRRGPPGHQAAAVVLDLVNPVWTPTAACRRVMAGKVQ